jgi:E3 ubiquitin-protein ligase HUWE1
MYLCVCVRVCMCSREWVLMIIFLIQIIRNRELELLISGMPEIDIHDLKKNTDYNGYRPADKGSFHVSLCARVFLGTINHYVLTMSLFKLLKEIGWFWNILFALTRSEKAAFLQFVTGSSKVPLAGFSELQGMVSA